MAKAKLQCPSCGSKVELGDVECKVCGVNLKSGEAYETRMKQARGKAIHPEHFGGRIAVGVVLAFGLFVFAGLMYQTQMVTRALTERPDLYQYPVSKLQQIDDLIAMGAKAEADGNVQQAQQHYAAATKAADTLIGELTRVDNDIKPEELYSVSTGTRRSAYRKEPEYHKRLAKRMLRDLRAKAESLKDRIPIG